MMKTVKLALAAMVCVMAFGCAAEMAPEPGVAGSGETIRNSLPCGGFAGTACPDGYTCVDDPTDNCRPNQGGADCMGYCKAEPGSNGNAGCGGPGKHYVARSAEECATIRFLCAPGFEYFSNQCGCGCQEVDPEPTGEPCGPNTCGADQVCCNASCGICTAPGEFCIQLACE